MIIRLFILFCLFSIINNSNGNNYNFNIDSLKTIIDTTSYDNVNSTYIIKKILEKHFLFMERRFGTN
jgi:hypothetical protein